MQKTRGGLAILILLLTSQSIGQQPIERGGIPLQGHTIEDTPRKNLALAQAPAPQPPAGPVAPVVIVPQAVMIGPGDDLIPYKTGVFINGLKSVSEFPLQWKVEPELTFLDFDKDGRKSVIMQILPPLQPDTQYCVTLAAKGLDGNKAPTVATSVLIFRTEPEKKKPDPTPPSDNPNPPNPPNPSPQNPVVPLSQKLYAILVFKDGERTTIPVRVSGLGNAALPDGKAMADLNCNWFAADDRTRGRLPDQSISPNAFTVDWGLANDYAVTGSPTMFVVDGTCKILADASGNKRGIGIYSPAPTNPADVIAKIKCLRGQ